MRELLRLLQGLIVRAFEIACFRSVGADLPPSRGLTLVLAALSVPFEIGEQWARGHGVLGMLIGPPIWLFLVGMIALEGKKMNFRVASAILLGMLPVYASMIVVSGVDVVEWVVAAWGALVIFHVLLKQHKEWRQWL